MNIRQVMAECDCQHEACAARQYCMADRIEALEAALAKADDLADRLEGQATHHISGQPHNPAMPGVFRALAAYRTTREATK